MKAVLIFLLLSFSLYGKEIRYFSDPIYLPISKEGAHLYFDVPIAEISGNSSFDITSAEDKKLKKKKYQVVYVEWASGKSTEQVSFLLANHKKVKIIFKYIKNPGPMKIHDSYKLVKGRIFKKENIKNDKLLAIALLKSMKKHEFINGFTPNVANIELKDGVVDVRAYLKGVYAGRTLNGFLVSIRNDSKRSVEVDHRRLKVGRPDQSIISYIDKKRIEPQEYANLYIVAKKPSRHDQIFIKYRSELQ